MKLVTILAPLVAVVLAYYLYLKKPDIRYQVSSPIPTETAGKVVQEIDVGNAGNAVAQKIDIKIRKPVGKLTIIKGV